MNETLSAGISVDVATHSSSTRSDDSLTDDEAGPALTVRSTSAANTCAADVIIDAAIESSCSSGILLIFALYDALDPHGEPILVRAGKHFEFFLFVDLRDERRARLLIE